MKNVQHTPLPPIDPSVVRRVAPTDDLVSIFIERARGVGLHVSQSTGTSLVEDVGSLVGQLASSGTTERPKVIIEPVLDCRAALEEALADRVELLDPHDGDDAMFAADIGVTGVFAAVAETGTLVCTSGNERWRGLTLIPPLHIAIVEAQQIMPDLVDLFAGGMPAPLPANVTLISGPSKTADIEGILITGVHGPREVHVVVVDK